MLWNAAERRADGSSRHREIIPVLQVEPELRLDAEKATKP
jgi:hypothetical protein